MVARPKIMVVEDTYLVARDIQDTLHSLGYLVTDIVDSGKEAVKKAVSLSPDLVLMDIKLKGNMDGIEAATRIHEQVDVPIIYLTALADDYTLLRAKRTEPSGYIIKPFNKEELHSSIEMALYKYKMENYLKDREELLSTTLKSISDAVITTDKNGFITFMNSNAEKLTGWEQEEILGNHVDSAFTFQEEKSRQPIATPYKLVASKGKRLRLGNLLLHTRRGDFIPITNVNDPIIDDRGQIIGCVISLRDISEERKLQKELEKAEKMEAIASRAKTIGHEFNNLLTVIRGNIDLMKQTVRAEDEIFPLIIDAGKAALKASHLTNQFLSFSKGEGLVKRTESLSSIINATIDSILGDSAISCSCFISEDIWSVDIDKGQISQVFYNILKIIYNIIEDSGEINISTENVEITETNMLPIENGLYVKATICGLSAVIPGDIFKQLFDPYFKNASKNEGLELSTSYSIIKNHGGYITVESSKEFGTSFYLYLPAVMKHVETVIPVKKEKRRSGERRVLVMDDQELVRIIAGKMLTFIGFQVQFARHGDEAIRLYEDAHQKGTPFDCVILDLTIPWGMGAKETIGGLVDIDPHVKAIVSTGYSNDPSLYNYRDLGFQAVIKKPYELQELSRILEDLLGE